MNYVNTASWKYILPAISILLLLGSQAAVAQQLPLDSILTRIDGNNRLLRSYAQKAEGYRHSADAATAWMAPMAGVGTFMTPYPGQMIMDGRDKGSLMLQLEQDIPNPAKLQARKRYIASQGNAETAARGVTLNELRAQARKLYYSWVISERKQQVLRRNEKIMRMMLEIEKLRYPYNQSQLGNSFKAEARLEENANMLRMEEGAVIKSRSWLNSLMNQPGMTEFTVDTTWEPQFTPAAGHDTASIAVARYDIRKMEENIRTMQLGIRSMQAEKKPDFRIRLDHMVPLDKAMPKAYSVMGMLSIPIAPWSRGMYRSEIKSMEQNIAAMENERSAMLQETQGMLYGMQAEIRQMDRRITSMENVIIPSLRKALDAGFAAYQENRLQLPAVIDAWEALTMTEAGVLDEKLKRYEMIVEYEKALYR